MKKELLINNVQIGSDLEWFLRDKNTHEIVSAEGIIKGTKEDPYRWDKNNKHYATSLDNVLAEGNIPPAKNSYQFYKSVEKLRNYIDNNLPDNLETLAIPSARLDEKYLETENAKRFGCEASYSSWTGDMIFPQAREEDNFRGAGQM